MISLVKREKRKVILYQRKPLFSLFIFLCKKSSMGLDRELWHFHRGKGKSALVAIDNRQFSLPNANWIAMILRSELNLQLFLFFFVFFTRLRLFLAPFVLTFLHSFFSQNYFSVHEFFNFFSVQHADYFGKIKVDCMRLKVIT